MLIATHYIEKDHDLRAASRIHKQTESARHRQVVYELPHEKISVFRVFNKVTEQHCGKTCLQKAKAQISCTSAHDHQPCWFSLSK